MRKAIIITGDIQETKILALQNSILYYKEFQFNQPPSLFKPVNNASMDNIPISTIEYELVLERNNGDLIYRKKR